MAHNRIVVGIDGSEPAQLALDWAMQEAARRVATVLVVTAWPVATGPAPAPGQRGELIDGRVRLGRMQQAAIERALAGLAEPPVVGREIILADPVTALCHAAALADLVVVGSDEQRGLRRSSIAARVAQRLSARRRRGLAAPLVVVPTPAAEPAPAGAAAPAATAEPADAAQPANAAAPAAAGARELAGAVA